MLDDLRPPYIRLIDLQMRGAHTAAELEEMHQLRRQILISDIEFGRHHVERLKREIELLEKDWDDFKILGMSDEEILQRILHLENEIAKWDWLPDVKKWLNARWKRRYNLPKHLHK